MFLQPPQSNRLTIDGIQSLVNNSIFAEQRLRLQVLEIQHNYMHYYYAELSDGFSKIKCEVRDKARDLMVQESLREFMVIEFGKEDVEVITYDQSSGFIINNCTIFNHHVTKPIGHPVPYNVYSQNNFQNPKGDNLIDTSPKCYTIKQILNNTRLKNPTIKAKITKIPDNIKMDIMNFSIMDEQGNQTQCVCFGEIAHLFFKHLSIGKQYYFSGFILQKNKITNKDELKFKKQAKIIPFNSNNPSGNLSAEALKIVPQNQIMRAGQNKLPLFEQNNSISINNNSQSFLSVTKRDISEFLVQGQSNALYSTVGKVTFLSQRPKFRKINILDSNEDIIDLLLWQQIKETVEIDHIYKFTALKIKKNDLHAKPKYFQLQSTKKTQIIPVNSEQYNMIGKTRKPVNNKFRGPSQQKSSHKQMTKKAPQNISVITLEKLIQISQRKQEARQNGERLPSQYYYVECTLKMRTQGFKFVNDEETVLSFFSFFCRQCRKSMMVNLDDKNSISCVRCKSNDVDVKWNLRLKVLDSYTEIVCSLQNETTDRLANMKPFDAYLMYKRDNQKFQVLIHKINFETRVCKFQIKNINGNIYYNILEVYVKDSQGQLNRSMAALQAKMKEYQELTGMKINPQD